MRRIVVTCLWLRCPEQVGVRWNGDPPALRLARESHRTAARVSSTSKDAVGAGGRPNQNDRCPAGINRFLFGGEIFAVVAAATEARQKLVAVVASLDRAREQVPGSRPVTALLGQGIGKHH